MIYALAYLVSFVVFAAVDITWLMTMGARLYKETLGDILLPSVKIGPAAAFYLMYPAGIVIFAVAPAIKSGSVGMALLYGALFGLFAYGTYELTNFATLRNWTIQITVIDMVYGALATAFAAAAAALIVPYAGSLMGIGR